MEGINIGQPLANNSVDSSFNPLPNVDGKYGPYASRADALTAISTESRSIGLTVGIKTGNTIAEYWFNGGTDDNNFVEKLSAGGGGYNLYIANNITQDTNTNLNSLFPEAIVKDVVVDTVLGGYYIMYQTGKWVKLNGTILTDAAPTVTDIRDVRMMSMK